MHSVGESRPDLQGRTCNGSMRNRWYRPQSKRQLVVQPAIPSRQAARFSSRQSSPRPSRPAVRRRRQTLPKRMQRSLDSSPFYLAAHGQLFRRLFSSLLFAVSTSIYHTFKSSCRNLTKTGSTTFGLLEYLILVILIAATTSCKQSNSESS